MAGTLEASGMDTHDEVVANWHASQAYVLERDILASLGIDEVPADLSLANAEANSSHIAAIVNTTP
jgi:hypothetical protein